MPGELRRYTSNTSCAVDDEDRFGLLRRRGVILDEVEVFFEDLPGRDSHEWDASTLNPVAVLGLEGCEAMVDEVVLRC